MEKAYRCPKCGADIILDGASEEKCVFCSTPLTDKDTLKKPKGGFYTRDLSSGKKTSCVCGQCGKHMYLPEISTIKPESCVFCGSSDLRRSSSSAEVLLGSERMPFRFGKEDAEKEYLECIRKQKKSHSFSKKAYLEAITPVMVPFFFFDYHAFARAVLSVVPYIKTSRHLGEKFASAVLLNDISFERTSSVITPYPKNVTSEMAWKNIPLSASAFITVEKLDEVSPIPMTGFLPRPERPDQEAVLLGCEIPADEIRETFLRRIREFVKECVVVENLQNFAISSFVDETEYEEPLGQMVLIPFWVMKKRKKNQCLSWYMNGISGEASEISWESAVPEVKDEAPKTVETMKKKKIRNFTYEDFGGPDRKINYRTYMIDTMASTIVAEMTLSEMSADKSLVQLERKMRRQKMSVNVPLSEAFQGEAEIAAKESQKVALPSKPVPLPTRHSALFLMKEEAMENSLGQGVRLPERTIDRRVGNEEMFDGIETPEHVAVDKGLADLPEYDPAGPNPFK